MNEFFIRGLSMLVTGALLVVILPALAHLFFSVGPFGFFALLFLFFFVGAAVTS
jgi:hypothetical protein